MALAGVDGGGVGEVCGCGTEDPEKGFPGKAWELGRRDLESWMYIRKLRTCCVKRATSGGTGLLYAGCCVAPFA